MEQLEYLELKKLSHVPRLPLEAGFDITYRCNNNCRHCWISIPADAKEKEDEFSFEQIRRIVDEGRVMGCRRWLISGGEPMLRPDFPEILDYISRYAGYSVNTNGTLITSKIARLLKRRGYKILSLYGATRQVHDWVTRNPGSFEALMRGLAYLKEAGVRFILQIIPMRANYHQFQQMVHLAESIGSHCKIGASSLYLSACGDSRRNLEIMRQRLQPKELIQIEQPNLYYMERARYRYTRSHCHRNVNTHPFSDCIYKKNYFYIDPYGQMSFCSFIKDDNLRYNLKKGNLKYYWEELVPSLGSRLKVAQEYSENCGCCRLRPLCYWCPAYAYLEHGRFSAKVEYLCAVAEAKSRLEREWRKNHRRYFRIAGIAIKLESNLPFKGNTFNQRFKPFEVDGPAKDTIYIRHYFSLPDLKSSDLGREVYRHPPWAVYKKGASWIYAGISSVDEDKRLHKIAVFNKDYNSAVIYNSDGEKKRFLQGNLDSLTLFPTDQILLAQVLANHSACYVHASGAILNGRGFLFVGRSGAGKSTIVKMLKKEAEILCDDRVIVRRHPEGFRIHGSWSHGEVAEVSASDAPLRSVLFLIKADCNRLEPLEDKKEIVTRLIPCVVKPLVTADWWDKIFPILKKLSTQVPCYLLKFDKSGEVVDLLRRL